MIRIVVRTLLFLGSAAVGLLVAATVIDGVSVTVGGFILTVVIFAAVQSIITPFLAKFTARNAAAFLGGVGLLATWVALLVTSLVGNSLEIRGGVSTWIATTVVVWLATAVASLVLPFLLVRAGVDAARERGKGRRAAH